MTTGPEGNYEVRYLTPGEYTVEIRAQGFKTERRTGIVLQISQLARIDFSLQIGQVQETVEVTATAPILQTENAVLGEVVATERIVNLPLNGRNFLQLSTMTPGVVVREESNGGTHTRNRQRLARYLDAGQHRWHHGREQSRELRELLPFGRRHPGIQGAERELLGRVRRQRRREHQHAAAVGHESVPRNPFRISCGTITSTPAATSGRSRCPRTCCAGTSSAR